MELNISNIDYNINNCEGRFIIKHYSESFISRTPYKSKENLMSVIFNKSWINDRYNYLAKAYKGFPLVTTSYDNTDTNIPEVLIKMSVINPKDMIGVVEYINEEYIIIHLWNPVYYDLINDNSRIRFDVIKNNKEVHTMRMSLGEEI